MDLTPLGHTTLLVSRLGLGTVKLGRTRGLKYPGSETGAPLSLPTDDRVIDLLRTAADLSINRSDTAPAYGVSEKRLGELMSRQSWFGGRDRWVISTKCGEEFDDSVGGAGGSRYDFTPEHTRFSVERSLRRLNIDTLDIVLVHSDGRDEWIINQAGTLDALRELKRRGLVRAIGISAKTIDGGLLALRESAGACDVVMLPYSPLDRAHAVVIDAARHRGVGVLIKKALASGHTLDLLNKMPPDIRAATDDPIEAAMRFTLGRAGVSSVIVGTTNPQHLRANVTAAERATASK
jgi:aryl-alcohol dehydrogenase-like predicted oxidoreductase